MAQRKATKQPKRGARKPNPSKPKAKAPDQLRPFKIVGHLVGAVHNKKGEVVYEKIMGEVAIWKADFSNVEQIIADRVEEAAEQERLTRETVAEMHS